MNQNGNCNTLIKIFKPKLINIIIIDTIQTLHNNSKILNNKLRTNQFFQKKTYNDLIKYEEKSLHKQIL